VTVTAAAQAGSASSHGMGAGATSAKAGGGPAQPAAASDSGDSNGLSIAALVVGGLGLLLGGGAFGMARRRSGKASGGPVMA
jgi:hypothetical protein